MAVEPRPVAPVATTIAWRRRKLSISIQFGELRLWTHVCDGAYAEPPILTTPPLDDLGRLSSVIDEYDVDVALCFSCPVDHTPDTMSIRDDCLLYVSSRHKRLYAETDQPFESYLGKFKKKSVAEIHRQERRIAETNARSQAIRIVTAPEEMAGFHRDALDIARVSFQWRMLGTGLAADPLALKRMTSAAEEGRAYGFMLHIDDRPAAFHYFRRDDDGVLLFSGTGYDPRYAKYSPGTVLMLEVLHLATDDPDIRLIDFDTGDFPYKTFFATRSIDCADAYYFRKTLRNCGVLSVKHGLSSATRVASCLLKKTHLHAQTKKLIRRVFSARPRPQDS